MIALLVLIPAIAGLVAILGCPPLLRRALLVAAAVSHTVLTASCWVKTPPPMLHGWFAVDDLGLYFLSITSLLFLVVSVYALGYLARGGHNEDERIEGLLFSNAPEAVFVGCLLFFLATMTLVTVSHHFGILWVAVEATTLASAPLIYFHRHRHSLEATWKYLLICSVGIALALVGNFLLAVASTSGGVEKELTLESLTDPTSPLNAPWLKAAFILFLVGYGTKMGLAPMHTWLPDAHSESPSLVSALLSGVLLNCAFLGILRVFHVCVANDLGAFARELLVVLGILSMFVAAAFVIGQPDYKRMLAYSSVEHMGILALGIGIGGAATYGAMLHAVNHSMAKGLLFLTAGNILAVYKTKKSASVRGIARVLPATAVLWIVGFLAITGSPPFGTFLSEFTILKAALDQQLWGLAVAYLAALAIVFIGMATVIIRMAQGQASQQVTPDLPLREHWTSIAPPALLGCTALMLGVYVPPGLSSLLTTISRTLGAAL